MKIGSRVRAWLLVMTLVMMVSPAVGAQTAMDATPETGASVETSTGDEAIGDGSGEGTEAPEPETPLGDETANPEEETDGDVNEPPLEGPEASTPDDSAPVDNPVVEEPVSTEPAGDEPATTPESSPQSRSGDVGIMAVDSITIDLVTSDGGPVPAGTQVCVSSSDEYCQDWTGETLTFSLYNNWTSYSVVPEWDSGYLSIYDSVSVEPGETLPLTLTLQKKATVAVSLVASGDATVPDGTQVCVYGSDQWCQTWSGTALTFTVEGGRVWYDVTPPSDSGFAVVEGTWDIAQGASVTQTVTLPVATTLTVTVVTSDGGDLPEYMEIYVASSTEGWQYFDGEPLTYAVAPGTVEYSVYSWGDNGHYRDVSGTVTVAEDGSTVLEIVLEPMDPGILRVYVQAEDGQPAPAGTQVCVSMPFPAIGDPVEDMCQTWTSGSVAFALGQGEAFVTVTPPDGSGFVAETESFHVMMDEVTRAVFDLEYTAEPDATVIFTLRVENPDIDLDPDMVDLCVFTGTFDLLNMIGCQLPDNLVPNDDGSVTATFSLRAGDYSYLAVHGYAYSYLEGSFTAIADETTTIDVIFSTGEVETATIVVDVVTLDGAPVPEGTEVCTSYLVIEEEGDYCALWEGAALTFDDVPAGPIFYGALPPDGSGYLPSVDLVRRFVKAGETLHLTVTLLPIESPTTISMTVSDETPRSGDTVTYTIRATGTTGEWADVSAMAYEAPVHFEIIDELPIEVSNISVSCGGSYMPSIPGTCYDLDGNSLTVFGGYWINNAFDITVTVTGTVVGEPGTVVTNTAYLLTDRWRGEPDMAIARYIPADSPSATAVLTIVQDPVDPTPSPTPDPVDPIPSPTPDPVEPTPSPTPDPADPTSGPAEPGTTPTPASGETPAAAGTPAAVTALPNTGAGGNGATPMLAILTLAAASLLAMGGMVIRNRAGHGRG